MMNTEYKFYSKENFIDDVSVIDINVPLRSNERKTTHTEKYSIVSFLKEFYDCDNFLFPFTLLHQDKPDFLITSDLNKIGIEFTESIPEQLAKAEYLREKHFEGYSVIEPEFFGWDAPDRTEAEILEILNKSQIRLIGQGFCGKSIEERWMLGIKGCISNKTVKLNKEGFNKYKYNWLLIYDNQTRAFLDKEYVTSNLNPFLTNYWGSKPHYKYDKIFIDSGSVFYVFNASENQVSKIIYKTKN